MTTFVLRSVQNSKEFLKGFDRSTPPKPILTPDINQAIHFPDHDTASLNRDSAMSGNGFDFTIEEVNQ